MKWNKLKKVIKNRIHPIFNDKLIFKYNGGHSHKFEIIYDNKILVTYVSGAWNWANKNIYTPVLPDEFGDILDIMNKLANIEIKTKLIHPKEAADKLFIVFNNLSIKEALNHPNKFIRAMALVDKRCGSRTFKQLNYSQEEEFLLRNIYNLRKHLEKQN